MRFLVKLIASGLYVGYSPVAPGTIGSIWGVVIYILLYRYPSVFVLFTFILFVLGFLTCQPAEKLFNEKDSSKIVIDEISSMCLVFLFIRPDWLMVLAGFLVFRFFDIVKPPPARMAERLKGGKAVMIDDIISALYTIVVLFILGQLQARGIVPVLSV